MSDELQTIIEYLADGIARQMCQCNHTLLFTGLDPDEILGCALQTFAEKVAGFKDAPENVIQDFSDRLGVALADKMLIEHDIFLMQRSGLRAQ